MAEEGLWEHCTGQVTRWHRDGALEPGGKSGGRPVVEAQAESAISLPP